MFWKKKKVDKQSDAVFVDETSVSLIKEIQHIEERIKRYEEINKLKNGEGN